jgi:hypothetical protein
MIRRAAVAIALVAVGVGAYSFFASSRPSHVAVRPIAADASTRDAGSDAFVPNDAGRDASVVVEATPPPTTAGIVFVRSRPIESEVWIDGEHVGRTPQQVTLAIGEHRLELRVSYMGGSTWHHTLHVSAERSERVDYFWPLPTPAGPMH